MSTEKAEISRNVIRYLQSLGFQRFSSDERVQVGKHLFGVVDLIVFDPENRPHIVVEIKANLPNSLDRFHPSIEQAFPYVETLNAKYLLITDSIKRFWYEIRRDQEGSHLFSIDIAPSLGILGTEQATSNLAFKTPENWKTLIWSLQDELQGSFDRETTSKLITELVYAKLSDEEDTAENGIFEFQVFSEESAEQTKSRIVNFINQKLRKNGELIFEELALSNLNSVLLQTLVLRLQPYKFKGAISTDIEETSFSVLLDAKVGQYFTPRSIVKAAIEMLDLSDCKSILDPAAGTGGFLIAASEKCRRIQSQAAFETPEIVGFENDHSLALLARTNLLLHGATGFKILEKDFLTKEATSEGKKYDLILTNPPFGSKVRIDREQKLPDQLRGKLSQLDIEALYLIQIISVLDQGKFAAILVPDGLLANPRHKDLREYVLSQCHVRAVVSLPNNAFFPFAAIKTSMLILQKKGEEIAPSAVLMMKISDIKNTQKDQAIPQETLNVLVETYQYFMKRGKLSDEGRLKLNAVLAKEISDRNAYRLDFAAHGSKYLQFIERLERGPYRLVSLGDIAEVRTGKRLRRTEKGVPLISGANLNDYGLDIEPRKYVLPSRISEESYIRCGDLLIAGVGSKFPVVIVPENFPDAVADDTLNIISAKEDANIYPEYLLSVFKHEIVKVQLDYLSSGASVRHITPSLLQDIRVPIPPLNEQHAIVEKMRSADQYIAMAKAELEAAQAIVTKALPLE